MISFCFSYRSVSYRDWYHEVKATPWP